MVANRAGLASAHTVWDAVRARYANPEGWEGVLQPCPPRGVCALEKRPPKELSVPPEELRLLVVASTYPARVGDGTPAFVRDLALGEAEHLKTAVLVPRVAGGPRHEQDGSLDVHRFAYFPSRWEDLTDGAILENLRERPSRWMQVIPFMICEAIAIRRLIRQFKPHMLHVHWLIPQGLVTRLVGRRLPRLVTVHGGDLYALNGRLPRVLKRWALRDAGAVTAMNADMRRRLDELGVPQERTHVLPMGAQVADLRAGMAGVERVPGRLLFVGRLVEKKGVAHLLEALGKLDPAVPWSLEVVGDGPLRPGLEAASVSLGDRVRFRGTLDRQQLAEAMGAAEIVVLPSVPAISGDQDGMPVVLVEGMAAGCAIVASRLPGLDEVVVDGVNGLLVPPADPHALAGAIGRLLVDAPLRQRLGETAAADAEDHSASAVATRYVALLREMVGEAPSSNGTCGDESRHDVDKSALQPPAA